MREKDGNTHRAPIFEPLPTDIIQVSEGLSQFGWKIYRWLITYISFLWLIIYDSLFIISFITIQVVNYNQIKLSFPNNLVLPSDQLILYSEDFISDLDFLELSITTTPETFCENFRRDECYFAFSDKTRINSRSFYEPRLSWWLIPYLSRKALTVRVLDITQTRLVIYQSSEKSWNWLKYVQNHNFCWNQGW